jgi:hypothetical protein
MIITGCLTANTVLAADKKPVPPTTQQLSGVWIGFDTDELYFSRLDLRPDSTGILARVSPADTILHQDGVHVYRVTSWSVDGWNITMQLSPLSNATKVGYVKGRIGLASLRLTMGGPEYGGWKEQLLLYPEARLTKANLETKEEIGKAEGR